MTDDDQELFTAINNLFCIFGDPDTDRDMTLLNSMLRIFVRHEAPFGMLVSITTSFIAGHPDPDRMFGAFVAMLSDAWQQYRQQCDQESFTQPIGTIH
jgi:hypothetical protein